MMDLILAFTATSDDPDEAEREVCQRATDWAAAEPNVQDCDVIAVRRPFKDRPHWFEVMVVLQMRSQPEQLTAALA